jgi:hypothetical protein
VISETIGSFPTDSGVKTEKGLLGANDYSLQLNSNFMNTAACDGASNPSECLDWEQFVYSSGYEEAFMQYWLINWNNRCPSGWYSYSNDCYTNSSAVGTPKEAIGKLKSLKLSGTAVKGGIDTLVFTVGTEAYSTTGQDSVVDLATAWTESEFNISRRRRRFSGHFQHGLVCDREGRGDQWNQERADVRRRLGNDGGDQQLESGQLALARAAPRPISSSSNRIEAVAAAAHDRLAEAEGILPRPEEPSRAFDY